jgi:hypothetical protein
VVLLADLAPRAVLVPEAEAPLLGDGAVEELDVSVLGLHGGGAVLGHALLGCREKDGTGAALG